MATARVITLVPASTPAVSFEEAFGEYSEARGKGRERRKQRREERKERKLERIEDRKDVRQARTAARDEVKSDRQDRRISRRERRKAGRQAIRTEQSQARQERRTGRQVARQDRRTMRKGARLDRRAMGKPTDEGYAPNETLEQGLDTATPNEMGGYAEQSYEPQAESQETYGDETQGGGYSEPQYGGGEGGYDYGPEENAPYEDEYYEEPESGEGVYDEEGDYVGEESGYLADYDAGNNFSGIDPEIQSTVDKLAWNAECVKRLESKRKQYPNKSQSISKKIIEHKKRFNELKSNLDDFSNCYGDYSSADGLEPKRRQLMIKKAWRVSQGKIKNGGRPMMQRPADDVVPVASDLNPSFAPNRIVVPGQAKSYATGTGLNGLDLQDDFDAPNVREVFIGADGSKSGISWGSVIVGVGLGVAAVWAIKKYKLLK